nr:carbohydrate sulfotransferase 11-like isoform X1 [Penaeus vannamei]
MPSLFQIPKVASTSMVHALLRVLGEEHYVAELEIGRLHTTLRRLMPSPRPDEDLVDFTSFLVVRHPFQRILSAYRDRLLDKAPLSKFRSFKIRYGREIIERYRLEEQPVEYSEVPTFGEFVEYLLDTPPWEYNEHWQPYYLICTPCHHRYNIVMHLESLQEDTRYLVDLTGLPQLAPKQVHGTRQDLLPNPVDSEGKRDPKGVQFKAGEKVGYDGAQRSSDHRPASFEAAFFREITLQQLQRLYQIYEIDFFMFGYDISPYDTFVNK